MWYGPPKTHILVIFANPINGRDLRPMDEQKLLNQCISRCRYRDQLELHTLPSATIQDLSQKLCEGPPFRILHFSGHATQEVYMAQPFVVADCSL